MDKPAADGLNPESFALYMSEIQRLGDEAFLTTYGDAYLLVHAADLAGRPQGTHETMLAVDDDAVATANTTFHVFPLRKSGRNDAAEIKLGREDDNDIVVEDETVSRYHASILREGDEYRLFDLGSRNGTAVGEDALQPPGSGDRRTLESRQTVRLGSVALRFMRGEDFLRFAKAFIG
jgi:hypothetical protein